VSAEQLPGTGGLEVVVAGRRHVVPPARRFVVGRGAGVDLDLDHPRVSREHLVLEPGAGGWTLHDRSRNGTFLHGERISRLDVARPTTVLLGGTADGIALELRPTARSAPPVEQRPSAGHRRPFERGPAGGRGPVVSEQGRLSAVHPVRRSRITIGRLPDSDVVLDDLLVSRRHAVLEHTAGGWTLTDLRSGNGTFVNGRRITEERVTERDVIGVGHALLQLDGDRLVEFVDVGGNTFEADGLTVTTPKGKTLLHSVGFALPGKTLMAVIGPSGAGTSTLLSALIGSRPADRGTVRYAGRDLYRDYDELRHRIALVPQDDVLHTQLTVRQALSYAARLRFPADTDADARRRRVEEVLAELGLTGHADQRITSLSGGQRKRTSVALELLTKPSLLFLDEPTSGLDPGMDRSVMRTLRELADDSRTVVVVTHNVANLEVCDQLLLLAPGGHVAWFGPPRDALAYFGKRDFADIFLLLADAPGEHWAQRFARSPECRRNMRHRGGPAPQGVASAELPGGAPLQRVLRTSQGAQAREPGFSTPAQQRVLTQLAVLVRRYVAVIASDKQYAVFLAVLPLVLSLLARAVPGSAGLSVAASRAAQDPQPRQLLLVLIIGAALMGAAASVRELVKERPVYLRERAIGLSVGAYLTSKVLVLGVVAGVQAALFTTVALLGRDGPDDPLVLPDGKTEVLLAVLAVTVASMLTGLLISGVIDNADRGMPLLVLLIMVQLILCGGLFEVYDRPVLDQLAWLVPSRWGFSMTAATAGIGDITRGTVDPAWDHTATDWFRDLALLTVTAVTTVALVVLTLIRLDPKRARRPEEPAPAAVRR
jgi:ABC-type multidrug transport system ATPase subunit/pSer/pThr/pTyr-binding forkhead associated (FHA) protein